MGTILHGRYSEQSASHQIVEPEVVVDGLLQNIFRVKNVLDTVILVVDSATALAIVPVFALSLRLRQREIDTIFLLACRRATVARLLGAEIFIIVLISSALYAVMLWAVDYYGADVVRGLFIG